jgi:hypothetical protein
MTLRPCPEFDVDTADMGLGDQHRGPATTATGWT